MTDKEFRHLKRAELIDIIYELQNHEAALIEENEDLKYQLAEKQLRISKAGSIAEAAISINQVMEAAQAAADQYVQEMRRLTEAEAKRLLREAQKKYWEIISGAESKIR